MAKRRCLITCLATISYTWPVCCSTWCFDEWQEFVYDSRKGQLSEDPVVQDKAYANKRVRRGGCWLAFAGSCSAHYRFWAPAIHQGDDTGFRVVRTL